MGYLNFSELEGKTIIKIEGAEKDSDAIYFTFSDGSKGYMYHSQDCCESVYLEDVIGDVDDLIGTPIVEALEDSNCDEIEGTSVDCYGESFTWTFYTLRTNKSTVTFRWYGSSNGYYGESADFYYEEASDAKN